MPDWIIKYWVEWAFGLLIAGLTIAWRKLSKRVKDSQTKNNAVELGVQALLRDRMIENYNRYQEKGYAPIYVRDSFENCYQQYHALGGNGVMKDIRDKFMSLPTSAPTKQTKGET